MMVVKICIILATNNSHYSSLQQSFPPKSATKFLNQQFTIFCMSVAI